jgi:hypothetical protein
MAGVPVAVLVVPPEVEVLLDVDVVPVVVDDVPVVVDDVPVVVDVVSVGVDVVSVGVDVVSVGVVEVVSVESDFRERNSLHFTPVGHTSPYFLTPCASRQT